MTHRAMQAIRTVAALGLTATHVVAAPTAANPRTYTVVINQMKFGVLPRNLRVGDAIVWVNKDIFKHSATARDHRFNVELAPSQTARTEIRRSGSVPFYCTYHPGMKGRLLVAPLTRTAS